MPPHDGTEMAQKFKCNAGNDLRDALQRLVDKVPSKVKKIRDRQNDGTLRINLSTVAMEAGRSRTLIGTDKDPCAYPEIREEIRETARRLKKVAKSAGRRHLNAAQTIEMLHNQVRQLVGTNAIVTTKLAAAVNVAGDLQKRLDQAEEDLVDARRVARGRPTRREPDDSPEPPVKPPKRPKSPAKPEGTVLPFTRDR